MKKKSLILIVLAFIFALTIPVFDSCVPPDDVIDSVETALGLGLGINGDLDDNSQIEDDIYLGTYDESNLPSSVDLSDYFPPIGDQGQYGTCVAWACGYNLRSFIDAKAGEYTTFTDSKKYSPKDLFLSISDRGDDCNGAFFESAFDVMVSRGVATLSTVPYTDLGDCSQDVESSWTSNANDHKIENYRDIDVDVATIKTYLANGRAVVFGAKLGDEFMDSNSDDVLDYQTYGYTGQHAYHAMILCGYDDSKGSNGAFRVVNSWGSDWGDNGYIWVDENFFVSSDFCFGAYVATGNQSDPDEDNDNEVDPDDVTSGLDLMAWQLFDVDYHDDAYPDNSEDPRWRVAVYNVYNTGETEISASEDWNILYLYYNAYDADDYGIILFDYYSNDYGYECDNNYLESLDGVTAQALWYNHVNIPSTWSVAKAVYNCNNPDATNQPFNWTYYMPNITGDYYLVIIADGFDQFSEYDESNNWAYFTYDNGDPLEIQNGVIVNPPLPPKSGLVKEGFPTKKGQDGDFETVRTETNVNAYTTKEIQAMIKYHLQTGELQEKAAQFLKENNNKGTKSQLK